MGGSSSKEDEDLYVFDRKYIAWDQSGNLRYGLEHPIERKLQLKEILEMDFVDEEEGKKWYVMSSAWIASWLAYVQFARNIAPCPGPCRNDHLLQWDYGEQKYVGRFGLFMARFDRAGDYRRVSFEVWSKFLEYYPGSGPAITMEYRADHKRESGEFDPAFWVVLDPPAAPVDRDNKKKKKKFGMISLGVKGKQAKAEAKQKEEEDEEKEDEEKEDGEAEAKGVSSLLGRPATKVNYGKGHGQGSIAGSSVSGDKEGKLRYSVDSVGQHDDLAKRRESFFEDVYFKDG